MIKIFRKACQVIMAQLIDLLFDNCQQNWLIRYFPKALRSLYFQKVQDADFNINFIIWLKTKFKLKIHQNLFPENSQKFERCRDIIMKEAENVKKIKTNYLFALIFRLKYLQVGIDLAQDLLLRKANKNNMETVSVQSVHKFLSQIQKFLSIYWTHGYERGTYFLMKQQPIMNLINCLRPRLQQELQEIDRLYSLQKDQQLSSPKQFNLQWDNQQSSIFFQRTISPSAKSYCDQLIISVNQIQNNVTDQQYVYQLVNQMQQNLIDFQRNFKLFADAEKQLYQNQKALSHRQQKGKQIKNSLNMINKKQHEKLKQFQRKLQSINMGKLTYDFKANRVIFSQPNSTLFELNDPIKIEILNSENLELFMSKKSLQKKLQHINKTKTQQIKQDKLNFHYNSTNILKEYQATQIKLKEENLDVGKESYKKPINMRKIQQENEFQGESAFSQGIRDSINAINRNNGRKQSAVQLKVNQLLALRKKNQQIRQKMMSEKNSWVKAYRKAQEQSNLLKQMIMIKQTA